MQQYSRCLEGSTSPFRTVSAVWVEETLSERKESRKGEPAWFYLGGNLQRHHFLWLVLRLIILGGFKEHIGFNFVNCFKQARYQVFCCPGYNMDQEKHYK